MKTEETCVRKDDFLDPVDCIPASEQEVDIGFGEETLDALIKKP